MTTKTTTRYTVQPCDDGSTLLVQPRPRSWDVVPVGQHGNPVGNHLKRSDARDEAARRNLEASR